MTCVARCQLRHLERSWRSIEGARLIEATYFGSLRGGVLGFCKCPREGHEELVVAIYLDTHLSVGPVDRTPWINHKL
ncbi:hypothetical protein M758_4G136100 [Ceratodon purpureus]|nr:hypothetical protein M758_4G136100 [Ceratodon purpureus]